MRRFVFRILTVLAVLWLALLPVRADASSAQGRYASIIVDADSLDILHAREIDAQRFPASLTKIMTLHMVFEAIDHGRVSLDTEVTVSAHAARTPPVKMGLRTGQRVSIDTLVQAVAVRSSNDAAVVLAEALAGSEPAFARAMTAKARALGMRRTEFRNATGLPDLEQLTTARDMAKLAQATFARFPQHYHYFGQESFRGRNSTNALLRRPDVDGFKTGYTRASGYNLVISATRDGRRLFAVVLGGASKGSRNTHMSELIERGFEVMAQQEKTSLRAPSRTVRREAVPSPAAPLLAAKAPSQAMSHAMSALTTDRWEIRLSGFTSPAEAEIAAATLQRLAGTGRVEPAGREARLSGLSQNAALRLCRDHGTVLPPPPRPASMMSQTVIPLRRCVVISR